MLWERTLPGKGHLLSVMCVLLSVCPGHVILSYVHFFPAQLSKSP